jgi:hypothetical protein
LTNGNTLTLATGTPNATIYYSVTAVGSGTDASAYFPYSTPLVLAAGTYKIRTFARRELLKDSDVVEFVVTVLADIYDQPPTVLPIFYSITALLLAIACIFAILVWKYRETRVIKASSPLFCFLMLLGCGFAYITAFMILKSPPSDGICMAVPFFGHIGFGLAFGSLGAKTWRLVKIFDQRKMEVMKISNRQVCTITLPGFLSFSF